MKKNLLFALIAAVVIFVWQFLSFAMPNFHKASMTYTESQDEILQKIEEVGLEEGMYFLGTVDPDLTREEQEELMEARVGTPWAVLNYQKSMDGDMVMPMVRGFIIAFIIGLMLFWLILGQKRTTLGSRIMISVFVGLISFMFVPYTNFIWFKEPDIWAYFADGIVPWVILGIIAHFMVPKVEA